MITGSPVILHDPLHDKYMPERIIPSRNDSSSAHIVMVQVRRQCRSELFSMLSMELDSACQMLLQLRLGKHLRQHERKCQVMYVNQGLCTSIEH